MKSALPADAAETTEIVPAAENTPSTTDPDQWVTDLVREVTMLAELHRGGKNAFATNLLMYLHERLERQLRQAAEIGDVYERVQGLAMVARPQNVA